MIKEVLGKCPVCDHTTEVTGIICRQCGTKIEGNFKLCKFCSLSAEQKEFIEIFIKCRGNIKEVEKELGISYPTVKNKLEDVAQALGYAASPQAEQESRRKEILEAIDRGDLSVDQALEIMKEQ
jgi:hypothetical protein